jgi:hypothetical protein
LAGKQRYKVAARGKLPRPVVRTMLFHKPVELTPGNKLQKPVKDAILMTHDVGSFRVESPAKHPKRRRINVMHFVEDFEPDSRGLRGP